LKFIFFTSDWSASCPEKLAIMARIFVFTTITNTCKNKHMQKNMQTGPMNNTILLG
jgi:hypothetical protein